MPDKGNIGKMVAIIPARGGSKRIPGKNIQSFLGKPIIQYSIESARESCLFDDIIVSTDDSEIAKIAVACGASVPFMRSKENSDDFATTSSVLSEVLLELGKNGRYFGHACCIYPCAPFVTSDLLQKACSRLLEGGYHMVLPVIRFGYPIWRALQFEDSSGISMIWPENAAKRSQDLKSAFHDSGQFYFFDTATFLQSNDLWNGNIGGIEVDELHAQDIDTISDWKIAELKYKMLKDGSKA